MRIIIILAFILIPLFTYTQEKANEIIFIGENINIRKYKRIYFSKNFIINHKGDTIYKKLTPSKYGNIIYTTIIKKDGSKIVSGSASNSMDSKFIATYKIKKLVSGNFDKDTISFIVHDHYGNPSFEKYKNVLIFLHYYKDNPSVFYHNKYKFVDIYETKSGNWATSYRVCDYKKLHQKKSDFSIKPQIIDFTNEVVYKKNERGITECNEFPEPYYKTEGNNIKAIYGNYLDDILLLLK